MKVALCSKKILQITGKLLSRYMEGKFKTKYIIFSESWILPLMVLFAIMTYTLLAIVFYNSDN